MYATALTERFGQTAEYLFAPPDPAEIDERGCLSKATCQEIDVLILRCAEKAIRGFYFPTIPEKGTNPNNKWRVISCLQKAIRFGIPDMAMMAASVCADLDPTHLRKRLMTIAAEDVAMGNAFAASVSLAMGGSPQWRAAMDERRLYLWLASMLAEESKDRTLVDMLVWCTMDKEGVKEVGKLSEKQLVRRSLDTSRHCTERLRCLWVLAGTERYGLFGMPVREGNLGLMFRVMQESGMTRFALWWAARVASRVGFAMFCVMMSVDEWLRAGEVPMVKVQQPPNVARVGKLLAASYDMYTREGKVAIARFFSISKTLREYKQATPKEQQSYLMQEGTFLAEGGVLNRPVIYGDNAEMMNQVTRSKYAFKGILPADMAQPFMKDLRAELPLLNSIRAEVLQDFMSK